MPKGGAPGPVSQIIALGTAQTIAWASSTYLPAVVGAPMAAEFGIPSATVFAAYSCALLIMAALGPTVGRAIDRRGGKRVLCLSNLVLAAGLGLLGWSGSVGMVFAAWAVIGAGMALGLYDAAFAALVRLHGLQARSPITGITLLGGFASTIGWPLTAFVAAGWDWRTACFFWAASHILLALPLNWFSLPDVAEEATAGEKEPVLAARAAGASTEPGHRRSFVYLALFGAATAFVTSAMAAHLPAFLKATGVAAGAAIAAAALVGPAQVAARLAEFVAARRFGLHPLATARAATALHPFGGVLLLGLGGIPAVAGAFAVLHGAGNGLITIAKGTLPLALFGADGYGARQGILAIAQRGMQAVAPVSFALVLETWGAGAAVTLTMALSALALLALLGIRQA